MQSLWGMQNMNHLIVFTPILWTSAVSSESSRQYFTEDLSTIITLKSHPIILHTQNRTWTLSQICDGVPYIRSRGLLDQAGRRANHPTCRAYHHTISLLFFPDLSLAIFSCFCSSSQNFGVMCLRVLLCNDFILFYDSSLVFPLILRY